jgi:hypothetical protein
MATSKELVQAFPGDYDTVFDAVVTALQVEGMRIVAADKATGSIQVSSNMSLASWGENVGVQVGVDPAGHVQVAVRSALKFGLVDWGKNQNNINRVFGRIGDVIHNPQNYAGGGAAAAAAAPAGGAWHPDPSGRHQHRWWDGTAWSDQVSDGGTVSSDPM